MRTDPIEGGPYSKQPKVTKVFKVARIMDMGKY